MNSSIALVLDPDFGDALLELSERMPVWIVSSAANDRAVEQARLSLAPADITTILPRTNEAPADLCLRALYEIDEHHGADSKSVPYQRVVILGGTTAMVSAEAKDELGFTKMSSSPAGFTLEKEQGLAPPMAATGTCP